jgi:hypothetical protein
VRREATTGYSPAHNALVERWFRTNAEMFIIQDKTGLNADIVYENVQDLCEITDLKWLGVDDDSEDHIVNLAFNNVKMKKSFIDSYK